MTDTAIINTEEVRLNNYEMDLSTRALLFGAMISRAKEVVKHYHSDLYHDALWLDKNVTGEQTFEWMVRPHGTHIGTDLQVVVDSGPESESVLYRIKISKGRADMWIATFDQLSFRRL